LGAADMDPLTSADDCYQSGQAADSAYNSISLSSLMLDEMQPLVLLNTVALNARRLALAPRLNALAHAGWQRPLQEALPAVTCTAQASMLTGTLPENHGIVGNGWLYRDTMEVRFWQQSNRLLLAEPVYASARRIAAERGRTFRSAQLFWWFNQGAAVDVSVTPKPHYGADGSKAFDILTTPDDWTPRLKKKLGAFPFQNFWGPLAGLPSTEWIARAAAEVLRAEGGPPDLTLVYLPHLDYDTQRLGPDGCDWKRIVGELDNACGPLLHAAEQAGARVWIVNEYAHLQVEQPVFLNRVLREAGLLTARPGPFGEQLDTFASKAFAVCDHQIAHVYVNDESAFQRVNDLLRDQPGIAEIHVGPDRSLVGLDHFRAGDLVALARPNGWFAYPFWLDDRQAPDYARTVDIHRKPGYDPCELFFNPGLQFPKLRVARKLLGKKLGFRNLLDVVPLDAKLVRGSHGLPATDPLDKPLLIGSGPEPEAPIVHQTSVRQLILRALDLEETIE
jgi:predicted AlkP superfamily pyrophosphatase or phosphodiesterase